MPWVKHTASWRSARSPASRAPLQSGHATSFRSLAHLPMGEAQSQAGRLAHRVAPSVTTVPPQRPAVATGWGDGRREGTAETRPASHLFGRRSNSEREEPRRPPRWPGCSGGGAEEEPGGHSAEPLLQSRCDRASVHRHVPNGHLVVRARGGVMASRGWREGGSGSCSLHPLLRPIGLGRAYQRRHSPPSWSECQRWSTCGLDEFSSSHLVAQKTSSSRRSGSHTPRPRAACWRVRRFLERATASRSMSRLQ